MSLVIPYTFTGGAGNKAKASEVNANFQATASKFTEGAGGIADGDIAASAAIKGTKLSNVVGNRIPSDRYEPGSVDATALKSDANAGAPNAAVNTAQHVKDGILTSAKLVPSALGTDRLKATIHTRAFSTATLSPGFAGRTNLAPTVAFPKATYDLFAVFIKNGGAVDAGWCCACYGDDAGANWAAIIDTFRIPGATAAAYAGTVVWVFVQKT